MKSNAEEAILEKTIEDVQTEDHLPTPTYTKHQGRMLFKNGQIIAVIDEKTRFVIPEVCK